MKHKRNIVVVNMEYRMSKEAEQKKYNIGICLLRIIFSFFVIAFHYHSNWPSYPESYLLLRELAVPIFLVIAFMLSEKVFASCTPEKIKKRMLRLIVPFLFWGIFFSLFYKILYLFGIGHTVTASEFFAQILFGCAESINPPLWFLSNVILVSFACFIIFYFLKEKRAIPVILVLAVLCIVIQYQGDVLRYFNTLSYVIKNSPARTIETFPYAAIGFLFAKTLCTNAAKEFFKDKWRIYILWVITIFYILQCTIIPRPPVTIGYSGLRNIVGVILLITVFYVTPFHELPEWLKKIITTVSAYSMGIYATHWVIGKGVEKVWFYLFGTNNTLLSCVAIFAVCFVVSFCIAKIPGKFSKMLVQ